MTRRYLARRSVPERFWSKVEFTSSCWIWMASTDRCGYGRFMYGAKTRKAHRWAYEFCIGPIPDEMECDHLCRTPACVLPDHIELVTHRINVLRGQSPAAKRARADCCLNGHLRTIENTRTRLDNGMRYCGVCQRKYRQSLGYCSCGKRTGRRVTGGHECLDCGAKIAS